LFSLWNKGSIRFSPLFRWSELRIKQRHPID
jgi:hypothetical protein